MTFQFVYTYTYLCENCSCCLVVNSPSWTYAWWKWFGDDKYRFPPRSKGRHSAPHREVCRCLRLILCICSVSSFASSTLLSPTQEYFKVRGSSLQSRLISYYFLNLQLPRCLSWWRFSFSLSTHFCLVCLP